MTVKYWQTTGGYTMLLLSKNKPFTAEEVVDKANIIELVQFERFCRDNSLWDEMKKTYSDHASIDISWYTGNADKFVDESAKMTSTSRAAHRIYNTQVWMNGDRAIAIMQATILAEQDIQGIKFNLNSDAKIVYEVQKINGEWLINFMTCVYEADSLIPVVPTTDVALDPADLKQYRSSYACLAYVLNQKGYQVGQDLPGVDQPEMVTALYTKMDAWLMNK